MSFAKLIYQNCPTLAHKAIFQSHHFLLLLLIIIILRWMAKEGMRWENTWCSAQTTNFLPKDHYQIRSYNFGKSHVDHDWLGCKMCKLNIGFIFQFKQKIFSRQTCSQLPINYTADFQFIWGWSEKFLDLFWWCCLLLIELVGIFHWKILNNLVYIWLTVIAHIFKSKSSFFSFLSTSFYHFFEFSLISWSFFLRLAAKFFSRFLSCVSTSQNARRSFKSLRAPLATVCKYLIQENILCCCVDGNEENKNPMSSCWCI